jgi:hypothetical protein
MKSLKNLQFSEFAFLLLFPGFFAYHSLVGLDYLNPFLGGFFRPLSIIFLPLLIFLFFRRFNARKIILNRLDYIFIVIIFYASFVGLVHYALGSGFVIEVELFESTISQLILNLAMYLLARTIDYENSTLKYMAIFGLFAMCVVVFLNIGQSGIFYLAMDAVDRDAVAGYQGFARSIVVTAIFVLATTKDVRLFLAISLIVISALFVNGARSELIGFAVSLFFMIIYKFNIKASLFGLIALLFLLLAAILLVPSEIIEHNRFMELLNEGRLASSAVARGELSDAAIESIVNNIFLGDYGSYALNGFEGVGGYAHNLLSAWVDLGVFGFILYVASFIIVGVAVFNARNNEKNGDVLSSIVVGFFFFTMPLMLFSKNYGYLLFGLTIGFSARMLDVARRKSGAQLRVQGRSELSAK